MEKKLRLITTAIGIGLLLVALLAAVIMVKTRPKAERKKMSSMVPVVETRAIEAATRPVWVHGMGTVIADASVSLQAEVNGRIVRIHPGLVEGASVRQGEVLVEVDPRDYELAVLRADAALQSARSSLRLEEGQQAVAEHEMELVGREKEVDPSYRDLMLRTPQLQAARAAVASAEAALETAKLNLERTRIRAPFDAVILAVYVDEGDYAQSSKVLVDMAGSSRFFVRTSLPISGLQHFPNLEAAGYAAKVVSSDGAAWTGTLYKLQPDLTEQGRMARLLVAVDEPLNSSSRPMLLGEAARVELSGRQAENVFLISRRHLRDGSTVWMVDAEGILHICPAEVVQGYADQVLVRFDAEADWELVTSNMAAPVDGMQLKTVGADGGRS